MENITKHSELSFDGVDVSSAGNQTVNICANCLTDTCNLNYKVVTTLIEYL